MNIRIGTTEDIEIITTKLVEPFGVHKDVAAGLVNINGCLLLEDANKVVTAGVLFAIAINDKGTGSVAKVIGVYGLTRTYYMNVLIRLSNLVTEVHLSTSCIAYTKVLSSSTTSWHKLDFLLEKFKGKIFIDSSTYRNEFVQLREKFSSLSTKIDSLPKYRDEWLDADIRKELARLFSSNFTEHSAGVYSFPFLSKSMCKKLIDKSTKYTYTVNDCEDTPYQMPEVVLADKDVALYEKMLEIFNSNIPEITKVVYAAETKEIRSIQLAKYSPETIANGNWHIDEDSDLTLVVSLSDAHEGGGTMIKPYGLAEEVEIPQLPVGHALLFRGKHYMHKGLPVTKGERNILVFWTVS